MGFALETTTALPVYRRARREYLIIYVRIARLLCDIAHNFARKSLLKITNRHPKSQMTTRRIASIASKQPPATMRAHLPITNSEHRVLEVVADRCASD
jgi:hypothetical protein